MDLGRLTTAQHQLGGLPAPGDPVISSYRYDDQPNSVGAMTAGGRIGSLTGKDEGGNVTLAHTNYSHVHAVSAAGNDVFTYDANGNMAARLFHEAYRFDVENRLTQSASYPSQTDYTYNGSGDLVRRTSSSGQYPGAVDERNVYVDGIYEQQCFSGGAPVVTKRYEAFGRVFAERRSTPVPGPSTLTYLLSDHLNSTVGTTTTAGEAVDRMQYYPFGSVRSGGVATDRTYTGQQTEAGSALKLSYYHARFYSAELGHFVSADSVTPTADSRGLNRYAYVANNPLIYTDPSGNCFTFMGTELKCNSDGSDAVNILRCALTCGDNWLGVIARWGIQKMEFWQNVEGRARSSSGLLNVQLLTEFVTAVQADRSRWRIMPWVGFFYFGLVTHTTAQYFEASLYALTFGDTTKLEAMGDTDFVGALPARKWWDSSYGLGGVVGAGIPLRELRGLWRESRVATAGGYFDSRTVSVARNLGVDQRWSVDQVLVLKENGLDPPYTPVNPLDLDPSGELASCVMSGGQFCGALGFP
jgi:RHS repeat-associated protein